MNRFKKLFALGKTLQQKSETSLILGIAGGLLIGVGADSLGLGIALAIALGATGYASTLWEGRTRSNAGRI